MSAGPQAPFTQTLGTTPGVAADTINTQNNTPGGADLTDPNGVSLTNLLTNIKV